MKPHWITIKDRRIDISKLVAYDRKDWGGDRGSHTTTLYMEGGTIFEITSYEMKFDDVRKLIEEEPKGEK
jgi:hypothetical protein